MTKVLTIGDTNRAGDLQIVDTQWDSNGTLRVTVRDLVGIGGRLEGVPLEAMRKLARRAISHPEQTRSARTIRTFRAEGCDYATFAVTRLDR